MKYLNFILLGIIGVLVFLLFWLRPDETTLVTTDTVHKTFIDTIEFQNTRDSINITNLKIIERIQVVSDSNLWQYYTDFEDSLIAGRINSIVKNDGTLVSQDLKYKPKFPKYIIRTDSITTTINNNIPTYKPIWSLYAGTLLGVDQQKFAVMPIVGLKLKNETLFSVGYNPFTKAGYAGASIRLLGTKRK